jgi:hypothetical protein
MLGVTPHNLGLLPVQYRRNHYQNTKAYPLPLELEAREGDSLTLTIVRTSFTR